MARLCEGIGHLEKALHLYELALSTQEALGDRRAIKGTQSDIAALLARLKRPERASALYEQALRTAEELNDVRSVALLKSNYSLFLYMQRSFKRALVMGWQAYDSLTRLEGLSQDAMKVQKVLAYLKMNILGPVRFDELWEQVIKEPQPEWLRSAQANLPQRPRQLSGERLEAIISNTAAVMTDLPEKHDEWREEMADYLQHAQSLKLTNDAEFLTAILAILDGGNPALPSDHPYARELAMIQDDITQSAVQAGDASGGTDSEVWRVMYDFINAKNWDTTYNVVVSHQAILFRPEVEQRIAADIARHRAANNHLMAERMEQNLAILRSCKVHGIDPTFAPLRNVVYDGPPLEAELIPRSVAALLGGPQDKMEYAQYLITIAAKTTDEELKSFINALQLVLFGGNMEQAGQQLHGIYRRAWLVFVSEIETGGVDPSVFRHIAHRTRVALTAENFQRSQWRSQLVEMRNQAMLRGNSRMVLLLDAVIGLLDTSGNPSGLGEGLTGMYAKTWQEILRQPT